MHFGAVDDAAAKRSPAPNSRMPDGYRSVPRVRPVELPARLKRALASALLAGIAGLSMTGHAAVILRGSDYFETVQPTFFLPLDALGMGTLNPLQGVPIGPGSTDTIVQRQGDCTLDLGSAGATCEIPIEMVALSLRSVVNSDVLLRESPTVPSSGAMIMSSDGSGTGGTFTSFFDVFVELSLDGGGNWTPLPVVPLAAPPTDWTTVTPTLPTLLVPGLLGDQDANLHTNRNTSACTEMFGASATCEDFFLVGVVREQESTLGMHSARPAVLIAEPATLALLLVAISVAGIGGTLGGRAKTKFVVFACASSAAPFASALATLIGCRWRQRKQAN